MTRLFHVSDVHFGAEDTAAIDWFGAVVRDERPDCVIVTGDLTMRARRREFAAAGDWLRSLGCPVIVQPGNHDLPYFNLVERFGAPYRRHATLQASIDRPVAMADIVIVPLSTTARFQWRLNWSKGHVSHPSLATTLAEIAAVPPGKRVLVACHHPLVEVGSQMTAHTRRGPAVLRALAAAGVDAVLTGHVHDPFDEARDVDGHIVRLIGAGTLSERIRVSRPSFNDIQADAAAIDVVARTMA